MGAHCESGTITGLLHHAGLEITEPLVFGLGSGLSFAYLNFPTMNFPVVAMRNRPGLIVQNVSKRTGIRFKTIHFSNPDKGESVLNDLIEKQIPTAARVDFFYMTYIPHWARVHINFHFITVVGKNGDVYYVSDSYHPGIAELKIDMMRKGRFAKGTQPPKGFLFYPVSLPETIDYEKAIPKSIKNVVFTMIKVPLPIIGVNGIYRFAEQIMTWPRRARDIDHLSHEIMKIGIILEDQGTGGGGFRFLYATYLRSCSEILNKPLLKEFAERLMIIGDKWRELSLFVGRIGKNRDLGTDRLRELSAMIRKRGECEKAFFTDLSKVF
jgi:hypothetical protein